VTKAVDILRPSKLVSQTQLLATDLELESLNIALKGAASMSVTDAILDGEISRTIEGASTVRITLLDRDRKIFRSGRLNEKADILLDGLWFRLVSVEKNNDTLTLIFEDREVAIMRTYNKYIKVARASISRARFIQRMVKEVKEIKIPFVCPEIDVKQAVRKSASQFPPKATGQTQYEREPGFSPSPFITVRGIIANSLQVSNTDRVLKVGAQKGAPRAVLVAAVETINVESSATNIPGGDRDSVGIFQQRPSQGWGTVAQCMNIEYASNSFFDRAIRSYAAAPSQTPGQVAQSVQRSAFPDRYEQHRDEAERTVSRWGAPTGVPAGGRPEKEDPKTANAPPYPAFAPTTGASKTGTVGDLSGLTSAELQAMAKESGQTGSSTEYEFHRGVFTVQDGEEIVNPENTWECSGRMAEEVNWRRFMVSGSFYFISENRLFRSAPIMRISEETPGVDYINCNYDTGKSTAIMTVTCRLGRWEAPPGSVIEVFDCGNLNGRWLVHEINRNLFNTTMTITAKKPRPKLAEPQLDQQDVTEKQFNLAGGADSGTATPPTAADGEYIVGWSITRPIPFSKVPSRATHETGGLPGYPAFDIMCDPNTDVIAPENGQIVRLSGKSPLAYDGGSVMGYSVYFEGDSGTKYFMTHLKDTKAVGRYVTGKVIGHIAEWPGDKGRTHLHFGISSAGPLTFLDFSTAPDIVIGG